MAVLSGSGGYRQPLQQALQRRADIITCLGSGFDNRHAFDDLSTLCAQVHFPTSDQSLTDEQIEELYDLGSRLAAEVEKLL